MRESSLKYISHPALAILIMIAATCIVYAGIPGHQFQTFWDDEKYVIANEAIRGITFAHLRSVFTTGYMGNYAPLHIVSYMLDYTLWGLKPTGFFITNIVLHLANGILFYALLFRLGCGRVWSLAAALVFLLHPVQVESVAWVSERKNLLAMFFFLLAFFSHLAYRDREGAFGKMFYAFTLLSFVAAVLCKSVAVIFPLVIVAYDRCYLEGEKRGRWLLDKLPFFVIAAITAWITIHFQAPGDLPGAGGGRVPWHGGGPYATLLTMLTVLPRYLILLFWPTRLSAIYDPPVRTTIDPAVGCGAILFLVLTGFGVWLFTRKKKLFFWYALFFIGLLPVSQAVPITTLMNDRYLYFPMLGAAALIAALLSRLGENGGINRTVAMAVALMAVIALACVSRARAGVWKNDLTLWSDAAGKSPNHYLALYGLAQAKQNAGDLDGALPLYLRVHRMKPRHLDTLLHLASLYRSKGMNLAGRPYLIQATEYYPGLAAGFAALGENYYLSGELASAERSFLRAIELAPESRDVLNYLGLIALSKKRGGEAVTYLGRLDSLGGGSGEVEYNLACAEALSGNKDKSLRHLEKAFRLGFRDRESIARDPDLDGIRLLPDFPRLVREYLGEGQSKNN